MIPKNLDFIEILDIHRFYRFFINGLHSNRKDR